MKDDCGWTPPHGGFFRTATPLEEVPSNEKHPRRKGLISRRGVSLIVGCSIPVVARLERQGEISPALRERERGGDGFVRDVWFARSDADRLCQLGIVTNPRLNSARRAAALWMLHVQGVRWVDLARAFNLSSGRVSQIVTRYQRTLDYRAKHAEAWLRERSEFRARQTQTGAARGA